MTEHLNPQQITNKIFMWDLLNAITGPGSAEGNEPTGVTLPVCSQHARAWLLSTDDSWTAHRNGSLQRLQTRSDHVSIGTAGTRNPNLASTRHLERKTGAWSVDGASLDPASPLTGSCKDVCICTDNSQHPSPGVSTKKDKGALLQIHGFLLHDGSKHFQHVLFLSAGQTGGMLLPGRSQHFPHRINQFHTIVFLKRERNLIGAHSGVTREEPLL